VPVPRPDEGEHSVEEICRTLRVRRTLATAKDGSQLTAPKTKSSRRTVMLTQGAAEALDENWARDHREGAVYDRGRGQEA
jgi:hypothetical protein